MKEEEKLKLGLIFSQFLSICMAGEFQTRRHDTNALEDVTINSAGSVCVTLSDKPPNSQILQQNR